LSDGTTARVATPISSTPTSATIPDAATTPDTDATDSTTSDTATTPGTTDATTSDTATTPDATTPDGATTPDDATTATTPDTADEPATATTATTQVTTTEAATTTQAATTQAATTTVITQAYRDQWVQEGSRWYYYDASGSRASGWVVNSTFKTYGLQRYWLDTTTKALASSELVKASEAGYWAYATRYGYVVRGRYTEGGVTYLADNDGRLESPGWHVSSAYGQGLQRYYVDSTKHGCTDGYSADGYAHYTTSAGYVLRGHLTSGTVTYLADNDGRLATSEGWHVSTAYGQGLQRYYVTAAKHGCVTGYSTAGWAHYTTPAGYVLRGAATCADGARRIADNDGRVQASGWLVTSAFGQGLQRYWLSGGSVAASRLVSPSEGAGYWAYATSAGYVLRGHLTSGTVTYLADNDGRLATSEGWHVSSAYGQGLQRYYVTAAKHGCVTGYSAAGWAHYTTSAGYVLRGHLTSGTVTYLADNDGRLATSEGWHVSSAYGQGLQRYYVTAAKHGCVTGYSAAGWAHYTTSAGYVLRGHLTSGTVTYLADNDGRLATSEGWHVSSAYGQGLQRYYVTAAKHGCVTGYSAAGWAHYTTPAGYVARGAYDTGAGRVYVANNDGRLAWGTSTGWVVQNYGSGLQRYYVSASDHGACSGFFSVAGYGRCFGVGGAGYVMRGKMGWGSTVLLADNEGKLATQSGWLVTGAYDGGTLQRYYMVNAWSDYKGARTGLFSVGSSQYYGRKDTGYVVRGLYIDANQRFWMADNDGRISSLDSLMSLINQCSCNGGLTTFGDTSGWSISGDLANRLWSALHLFWDSGQSASFVLMDLTTGAGCSYDPSASRYAASCFKAAYIAYICQDLLDTGRVSQNDVADLMERTAVWSDNDAYLALRGRFGSDGVTSWLNSAGIYGYGSIAYPWTNARDLARIWTKIGTYLMSGSGHSGFCRQILDHGYFSEIHATLGGSSTTYSKPGWYPPSSLTAYNDSGIIISNGRPYLMTVMTTANCNSDAWKLDRLIGVLSDIHSQMA
jgi:uncharacterized protein (DUF169 family)